MAQITEETVTANTGKLTYDTGESGAWATARNATDATEIATGPVDSIIASKDGTRYIIGRLLLEFDLSDLPIGANVLSATLTIARGAVTDNENSGAVLTQCTSTTGVLTKGNYNDITLNTPTELANRLDFNSIPAPIVFTLNANGKTLLETQRTSGYAYVRFMVRNSYDVDNTTPSNINGIAELNTATATLTIDYIVGSLMMKYW